ncbi:hypothetical protein DL766_004664 [Monosporascus sp. MC13-8B]|uniref:diphosphoinositol-polyphosphate diphosphatase n=1 Tax=Monosporascus cannonballus TaxID=155416 RepID=A0ABY0HE42_9PEZI|nr:hypothetical protein DL763_007978 [Monosporascus cannonballus]RYO91433.1 hypothetical protein DL762_002159 [Monosporascus cannonballus]RYP30945.1 hypothetical protein DL766_004664 [Monosporascus sp. MC13-8B]
MELRQTPELSEQTCDKKTDNISLAVEGPLNYWDTVSQSSESFHVVTNDMYISAKDIAVERPIIARATQPINFGVVVPGLYRSGYPQATDYSFMQGLGLKTIVTLVGKEMPDGYHQFIAGNSINHQIFEMSGTKKSEIPLSLMKSIAGVVMNRENYPLLIHCNHGKHRTGCVVGIIRKQSAWDVNTIIQEYTEYAAPKVRASDIDYIRNFSVAEIASVESLLPSKPRTPPVTIGTFLSFLFLAFFAICIWIFSGSKLLVPAPSRRQVAEAGSLG